MTKGTIILMLALAGTLNAADSYVVVRLNDADSRGVVSRSGAVEISHPDLRANEVLVLVTDSQLEALREEPAVELIYAASDDLVKGIPVNGCIRDESSVIGAYVMPVGDGWTNGGRIAAKLTYSVSVVSPKLGRDRMLEAIQRGLEEWSRYVQLDFTYTDRPNASRNLNFLFASREHGDGYPFDGRGRMLAHSFYPNDVNPEPLAGDLHFDEDENWQSGVDPDFYSVVLHEIGHALGLGHADRPTAVMYPYYRRLEKLQADDVSAIRSLYATRQEAAPKAQPSTPANTQGEPNSEDRTPPRIAITSPGTTISATSALKVRITGSASDNEGVVKVTWTASGGRTGVATGTGNWTISDLPLRQGDNTIVVRAYDQAGNTSWRSLTITRR